MLLLSVSPSVDGATLFQSVGKGVTTYPPHQVSESEILLVLLHIEFNYIPSLSGEWASRTVICNRVCFINLLLEGEKCALFHGTRSRRLFPNVITFHHISKQSLLCYKTWGNYNRIRLEVRTTS